MRPPERTRIRVSPGAPALLAVFVWLSSPEVLGAVLLAALCHELGHYAALRFFHVQKHEKFTSNKLRAVWFI